MRYNFARSRAGICLMSLVGAFYGLAIPEPVSAASPTEAFNTLDPDSRIQVDHAGWDVLLKTYVVTDSTGLNRVDYARFRKAGHKPLKTYLAQMQSVDPTKLGKNEQFAFFANLYNAKTVDVVLDAYPVRSIKDINLGGGLFAAVTGGPWKAKVLRLNGVDLSLDDIEHGVLRPVFKDPRVHYAVNCASVGCPNLQREAFTGSGLNGQLDAAAWSYVNSARGFRFVDGKLTASSIYSWFKDDFGGSDKGVLAHAARYAEPKFASTLKSARAISDFYYDWSLNALELSRGASR